MSSIFGGKLQKQMDEFKKLQNKIKNDLNDMFV